MTYLPTPDASPTGATRSLDWAPVICISGVRETDSLCSALAGRFSHVIALPGCHFMNRDDKLLVTTLFDAFLIIDPKIAKQEEQ